MQRKDGIAEMSQSNEEVSSTLGLEAGQGGKFAASALLPLVYDELKQLARQKMASERPDHTLQPTALVHEAYLRLTGNSNIPWSSQRQFFFAAAEAMRRVLIDHARSRGQVKRGRGRKRLPLNVLEIASDEQLPEILALDEALSRLEKRSPDVASVVRLRFYGGLTIEETADTLGISPRTVKREWTYGRAWLFRELNEQTKPGE
jgi:RNA polymerase sigma factor (TIGR02999 family)